MIWTNEGVVEIQKIIVGQSNKTINKFIVGKSDTAPQVTDTELADRNTNFNAKLFDIGYPIVDAGNKQTVMRGTVSSTEANDVPLAENALVDTEEDVMFARATHSPIAKNLSTEVIYEWKYKIKNE